MKCCYKLLHFVDEDEKLNAIIHFYFQLYRDRMNLTVNLLREM